MQILRCLQLRSLLSILFFFSFPVFADIPPTADSDYDGTYDSADQCPYDPDKTAPGVCGCGVDDTDVNASGTTDCLETITNLALTNYNGLTFRTYNASSTYYPDSAESAFDGHILFGTQVNSASVAAVKRGAWLSNLEKVEDQWVSIEFTQQETINSFKLSMHSSYLTRTPKDVVIQSSVDGINYVDHQKLYLRNVTEQTVNLSSPLQTQYFRLWIDTNHGDLQFIQIDELELYSTIADADSDGDGTNDSSDMCVYDPGKTAPGVCGCGFEDSDHNGNSTTDCNETLNNIALIHYNSLGAQSYSASSTFNDYDAPEAAFDGYTYNGSPANYGKISADAGPRVRRGMWVSAYLERIDQWLAVDFGQDVTINAFRLAQISIYLTRLPKDITIQYSTNGIDYQDFEEMELAKVVDQTINLSAPLTTRYFRMFMHTNHGDAEVIQVDELEIYSTTVAGADSDSDGTLDDADQCDYDPNKTAPGTCGCGVADSDFNGNGTADCSEQTTNIALTDYNGLSFRNYSASSSYHPDAPVAAFDGHIYSSSNVNPDSANAESRGAWLSELYHFRNEWLAVDFNQIETINAFKVMINSNHTDRLPQNVTIQSSVDGINYVDHQDITLREVTDQTINLSSPLQARYFRMYVHSNFGDMQFIQIGELELYSNTVTADSDGDGTFDSSDQCVYDPAKTAPGECGCFHEDNDANSNGVWDCNEMTTNIALREFGGLSDENYSASTSFNNVAFPAGAFDGYIFNQSQVNNDATAPIGFGPWQGAYQIPQNQWLAIDFEQPMSIESLRFLVNINYRWRLPGHAIIQYSDDGENYNDYAEIELALLTDQTVYLSPALDTQYLRLWIYHNQGDAEIIQIGELEINGSVAVLPDTDGDGTPDNQDQCPNDPLKIEPGSCGCGNVDTDTDGDGVADCVDECATDPLKTEIGTCGCHVPDVDDNNNGITDCSEQSSISVTVDPSGAAYYRVNYGSNKFNTQSFNLSNGANHNITFRHSNVVIPFSINASGVITSSSPWIDIDGHDIKINTVPVIIDPNGYQGNYTVTGKTQNGLKTVYVVPEAGSSYQVYLVSSSSGNGFNFSFDSMGDVVTGSTRVTVLNGDTIQFNTVDVNFEPNGFGNPLSDEQYNVGGWGFRGPATVKLLPAGTSSDDFGSRVKVYLAGASNNGFYFDLDSSGQVISDTTRASIGANSTVTFNTGTVNFDTLDYDLEARTDNQLLNSNGLTSLLVVPTGSGADDFGGAYTIRLGGDFSSYGFRYYLSSAGTVSTNSSNITTNGNTLSFSNTVEIAVDPTGYTGNYRAGGIYTSGINTYGVLPTGTGSDDFGSGYALRVNSSWSTFSVDDPCAVSPSTLVVNSKTFNLSCFNNAPVANAGADQAVYVGDTVTLDASQSTDLDGDLLAFSWELTSVPSGSAAQLNDVNAISPTFVIDVAGVYTAELTVNDGTENSLVDEVTISTINVAPVANAGSDQSYYVGDLVTLNGSGSSDADGDLITYAWTLTNVPTGSTAVLNDATLLNPSFTIDLPGEYVASLVVNDGNLDSVADTVTINTYNVTPVADAGTDQAVYVGDVVVLDGSQSSDADGDPLTYSWNLIAMPSGSGASLLNPTTVNPSFTVDVAGVYVVELSVNDGTVNSALTTVSISTINVAPVASAGGDQAVYVGDIVTLDGSSSFDADGDSLTYNWSFSSKPTGSNAVLDDASLVDPTFDIDVAGVYVLSLAVSDGALISAPSTVTVSTINVAPVANAGDDQAVFVNDLVSLDASQSTDADGDALTYLWSVASVPSGSIASLSDDTAVSPSFTVDLAGVYVFNLVVNDGTVSSAPASVTVSTVNVAPVANAGQAQSVFVGELVSLDGSNSTDVDGDPLSFSWSFSSLPAGSSALLSDVSNVSPTFTPDLVGTYILNLIVDDGTVNSAPASVMITAVTSTSTAMTALENLLADLNGLPNSAFRQKPLRKPMAHQISKAIDRFEAGDVDKTVRILETQILPKVDGFATQGSADGNDFIVEQTAQTLIYTQVVDLINLLNAI